MKWSARMYVEDALANGAVLMNGAKVKKVIIENKIAIGVEFIKGGKYLPQSRQCTGVVVKVF